MTDILAEYFSLRDTGHDNEAHALIKTTTEIGLQKVKSFSFVQICLAALLTTFGIATLVVASENIGFPVFNIGPIVTGTLLFFAGATGTIAAVKGIKLLNPENVALSRTVKCMIRSNFALSVVVVLLAIVSSITAFTSGAACAGTDIYIHIDVGNKSEHVDIRKYCDPNARENAALAFVDGFIGILVIVWNMCSLCLCCRYASWFGLQKLK